MVFTDEQKRLIDDDATKKKLIIHFPNGEREDITNSEIYTEEFYLEESLLDQSNMRFGKCNGALLSVKVANFQEVIDGADIKVSCEFINEALSDTSVVVPFGKFIVKNAERTSDKMFKIITATDYMTKFDVDISYWYNNILYENPDDKIRCKEILRLLCEYVGVEYDTDFELFFGDIEIEKSLNPTSLSARSLLEQLCEFNICFGHFNQDGILSFVQISEKGTVYPSEELYPSDYLFPSGGDYGDTEYLNSVYKNCDYKDYDTSSFDGVSIRGKDGNVIAEFINEYATEPYNIYNITSNSFFWNLSETVSKSVIVEIYDRINNLFYRPCEIDKKGGIYIQLGTLCNVTAKNPTEKGIIVETFDTVVLKRVIYGIQGISTRLSADTNEYAQDVYDDTNYSEFRASNSLLGDRKLLYSFGIQGETGKTSFYDSVNVNAKDIYKYKFFVLEIGYATRGVSTIYNSIIYAVERIENKRFVVSHTKYIGLNPDLHIEGMLENASRLSLSISGYINQMETYGISLYGMN